MSWPVPHDWAGGLWCPHGPVGCLLIKTPPFHWLWTIFSIIRSHRGLSGLMLMTRARVPMMLWPPVPLTARAPAPLTSDCGRVTRSVRAIYRHQPSCRAQSSAAQTRWAAGARAGLYLGHPQVLSRGFGRAWEIWPPPFPQHKMEKFWQKWINLIPGDFCQTVSHTIPTNYLLCQYLWTQPNAASEENIKLRGRS